MQDEENRVGACGGRRVDHARRELQLPDHARKHFKENGISYAIGLELGNPEAIKRCVMSGSAISLLPRMAAAAEIGRGELVRLPFAHPDLRLTLLLALHPKKWISTRFAVSSNGSGVRSIKNRPGFSCPACRL
ncbi:LysR substrate-binding domain-containing protein [Paenibacillus sp. JTLBN-2024]